VNGDKRSEHLPVASVLGVHPSVTVFVLVGKGEGTIRRDGERLHAWARKAVVKRTSIARLFFEASPTYTPPTDCSLRVKPKTEAEY